MIHKWDLFIHEAVWAIQTQISRVTGYSSYYLVYGKEPRTSLSPIARPFIFDLSDPRDAVENCARELEKLGKAREAAQERRKMNNQKAVEAFNKRIQMKRDVMVGDLVRILIPKRNWVKLGAHSEGLFKVTEVTDNNTIKLIDPKDPMAKETKYISWDNVALVGTTNPATEGRKEFHGIKIIVPKNPEVRKHVWTLEELRKVGIRIMS